MDFDASPSISDVLIGPLRPARYPRCQESPPRPPRMAEAHVFENRQVDEARRAHAIAIRIRRAVADEIEAELAFRRFDAAISFARFRTEAAQFRFRINDRAVGNFRAAPAAEFSRTRAFPDAHHVAVINVAVIAERNAEFEAVVDAVFVHLADVVVHAAARSIGPVMLALMASSRGKHADVLRARHENFVPGQQRSRTHRGSAGNSSTTFLRLFQPAGRQIAAATAEAHVIAHHPRAGERLEQVENFFALAKRIHQRRAGRAHVLQEKTDRARRDFAGASVRR